jgi:signal transduction histidine kinase
VYCSDALPLNSPDHNEAGLANFARLAAQLAQTPIASITLVNPKYSCVIAPNGVQMRALPERWTTETQVVAVIPIGRPEGIPLGRLTLLSSSPHTLTTAQRNSLELLVQTLLSQLELIAQFTQHQKQHAKERGCELRLRSEKMDEAQYLAAELHDGVGQELVGISMMLTALSRTPQGMEAPIHQPLTEASRLTVSAIANCRRLSEGYGGFLVRRDGVTAALKHLAGQFDSPVTQVIFEGEDIPVQCLDQTAAYYLFGIGREALRNACRHAQARTIRISCLHVDHHIKLSVIDDGVGLGALHREISGIGRSIMEYRARNIDAALSFTDVPGGGLKVECLMACQL